MYIPYRQRKETMDLITRMYQIHFHVLSPIITIIYSHCIYNQYRPKISKNMHNPIPSQVTSILFECIQSRKLSLVYTVNSNGIIYVFETSLQGSHEAKG